LAVTTYALIGVIGLTIAFELGYRFF